jgi:uncharacterized protein
MTNTQTGRKRYSSFVIRHYSSLISRATPLDPRYLQGIDDFNRCAFFHAHEVWEELWHDTHGPAREFYQGLIQVAVCLHHFGRGNLRGARKLYHSSTAHLRPYLPRHAGLDLAGLLRELDACCAELLSDTPSGGRVTLVHERIPRCRLSL